MRTDRGTVAVLLADFLVTIAVTSAAFVYDRLSPLDLLALSLPTFTLFFLVGALLARSGGKRNERRSR